MRQMEDKTKEELQKAQQANSSSVPKVILAVRSDYNLVQSCQIGSKPWAKKLTASICQVQKKLEETTKKADKSDTDYSHSVNNLKAVQDRFYDNEMPAILKVLLCCRL